MQRDQIAASMLVLWLATAPGRSAAQSKPSQSTRRSVSVHQLVERALRRANLSDPAPGWMSRARWSALLPRVSARLVHGRGYASYFDLRPDAAPALDANSRASWSFEVGASWDLSRLGFNRDELAAAAAIERTHDVRRRLAERVIKLFFRRRQRLLDLEATDPLSEQAARLQRELHLTEALLFELTGHAFDASR